MTKKQLQDIAVGFHSAKRKQQQLRLALEYYEDEQAEDAADDTDQGEDDADPALTEP